MKISARFGGYIRAGAIFETFSVCVQMSRNIVVSFAEGYSDVLDDKKIGGYMIFCRRFGATSERGLYSGFYSTLPILLYIAIVQLGRTK